MVFLSPYKSRSKKLLSDSEMEKWLTDVFSFKDILEISSKRPEAKEQVKPFFNFLCQAKGFPTKANNLALAMNFMKSHVSQNVFFKYSHSKSEQPAQWNTIRRALKHYWPLSKTLENQKVKLAMELLIAMEVQIRQST